MRVFGRGLILSALVWTFAPAVAGAAPFVLQFPDGGADCTAVLGGRTSSNCSFYDLSSSEERIFDLTLQSDADVALFGFSVDADWTFAAETSPAGLFPLLGLFTDDDTKPLYSYIDSDNVEQQAFGFDRLDGVLLDGVETGTTYYLAVMMPFNGFGGTSTDPTSLLAPFACDGENGDGLGEAGETLCPDGGGSFRLQLSLPPDGGPQPVPEPATLTLLGTGLLAAVVRRRTKKRS